MAARVLYRHFYWDIKVRGQRLQGNGFASDGTVPGGGVEGAVEWCLNFLYSAQLSMGSKLIDSTSLYVQEKIG
jgi:hypothetical protein